MKKMKMMVYITPEQLLGLLTGALKAKPMLPPDTEVCLLSGDGKAFSLDGRRGVVMGICCPVNAFSLNAEGKPATEGGTMFLGFEPNASLSSESAADVEDVINGAARPAGWTFPAS